MASWHTSLFDDVQASPEGNSSETGSSSKPQSTAGPADTHERQHIRLACQACQRKKIKCDRFFPCGQCSRSNLHCVPSTRKPRAKHTGKRALDSELRNRISKLENLVESLNGDVAGTTSHADSPDQDAVAVEPTTEQPITARKPSVVVEKYMGSQFWSSLTSEVQALRDALEEDAGEGEEDDTTPSTSTSGPSNSAEYDLLICPPGAIYVMPGALNEPNAEISAMLCTTFLENVDNMFKMFHRPSLHDFMIGGASYLGQDPSAPGNKAIKAAVWFSAVNTLTDNQCRSLFGQPRSDALQQTKRLVDVALSQADLMNTSDIATLQAFVTYLVRSALPPTCDKVLIDTGRFSSHRLRPTNVDAHVGRRSDSQSHGSPSRGRPTLTLYNRNPPTTVPSNSLPRCLLLPRPGLRGPHHARLLRHTTSNERQRCRVQRGFYLRS